MESLDSKNLGRLRRVANARDVWVSESGDFTPWLADNIDVLAEALGTTLQVVGTEVPVGDFRLDIHAEDADGNVVIIENQLERTDHSHLGQCLVYASGLEASTVVWVTPEFRDDFRRALDWLNERTDEKLRFFGVEVAVVQIGDGPRAPVFDVVARPNDWQKEAKRPASQTTAVSAVNARRQDLFAQVLTEVSRREPSIRVPARSRANWIAFSSRAFGYWSMSINKDMRVEAYIDTGVKETNKALFDHLRARREQLEPAIRFRPLSWERLDDKRACRIALYQPLDLDDAASVDAARRWAIDALLALYGVLDGPLTSEAKALRERRALGPNAADADNRP